MSDFVVQNCGAENKASILGCAVTGGLAGFALKYAAPLSEKEKANFDYAGYNKKANSEIEKELANFRKAIKEDAATDAASKIFADTFSKEKGYRSVLDSDAFKAAKTDVQDGVKLLVNQYHTLKTNGAENAKNLVNGLVKSFRSTNLFVGVGVLAGAALALAKNALDENGRKLEERQRQLDIMNA